MEPFDNFCQALFERRNNMQQVLYAALQLQGTQSGKALPNPQNARQLIEDLPDATLLELIYRFFFYSPENVFTTLAQYKNAHPERNQFVNEFLQNADDAGAHTVVFEFWPNEVRVFNDGKAFTHENLYSICSFNESDKGRRDEAQIGLHYRWALD